MTSFRSGYESGADIISATDEPHLTPGIHQLAWQLRSVPEPMNLLNLRRLLEGSGIPISANSRPSRIFVDPPEAKPAAGLQVTLDPIDHEANLAVRLAPAGRPLSAKECRALAIFAAAGGKPTALAAEISEIARARLAHAVRAKVDARGLSWEIR